MSNSSKKIMFVTGASRSGTTMLNRIFAQHSKIYGLNELHVFGDLVQADQVSVPLSKQQQVELTQKIIQRQQHGIFHADKQSVSHELLYLVADRLDPNATAADVFMQTTLMLVEYEGKAIPCEQTPRNIFYAQQLLDAYPGAHIVHIVRDPRSVLASQKSKWRRKFLGGGQIPWLEVIRMWCNYHPATLSKLWVRANKSALALDDHPRFHLVKFEQLLASPQTTLSKLCVDLDVSYEDQMLDIAHEGSSHQYNADEEKGISNATTESWKSSLSRAEIHISQQACADMMKNFDYQNVANSASLVELIIVWCRFPVHIFGVAVFNPRRAKIQLMSLLAKVKS